MVTKDCPQLNKGELKILQVCVSMQVLLPPPEIKMLNRNHIFSSLPKQTVNVAPPDQHASACRKNGGMLYSLSHMKTHRLDETRLSKYFGLCPFIWFSQNTKTDVIIVIWMAGPSYFSTASRKTKLVYLTPGIYTQLHLLLQTPSLTHKHPSAHKFFVHNYPLQFSSSHVQQSVSG